MSRFRKRNRWPSSFMSGRAISASIPRNLHGVPSSQRRKNRKCRFSVPPVSEKPKFGISPRPHPARRGGQPSQAGGYDLPWNPNRIEQRIGRIHRIGRTEVCHLWNLLEEGAPAHDAMVVTFH